MAKREPNKHTWRTIQDMAGILDVSVNYLRRDVIPLLDDRYRRRDETRPGRPWIVHARSLIEAWARERFEKQERPRLESEDLEELLAASGGSPALERVRRLQGDKLELEIAEKRRILCPTEKVREAWSLIASIVRRSLETLDRDYGHDAVSTVEDALEESDQVVSDYFDELELEAEDDEAPAEGETHDEDDGIDDDLT